MNTEISTGIKLGVKVGKRELLFSGSIHTDQSRVDIEIDNVVIRFSFINDDGNPRFEATGEDKILTLNLYNHNNALGEGVFTPMEIGILNNRKLSLTYYVNTLNKESNSRRLEVVCYLGEST